MNTKEPRAQLTLDLFPEPPMAPEVGMTFYLGTHHPAWLAYANILGDGRPSALRTRLAAHVESLYPLEVMPYAINEFAILDLDRHYRGFCESKSTS